jgi:hypothetical protein
MTDEGDQSTFEQRIRELEKQRLALNKQLMDAQSVAEANEIERELWALRTAISRHKSKHGSPERRGFQKPNKNAASFLLPVSHAAYHRYEQ